ncbi:MULTISPECIES: quinone-dependent dihydroorotate dehydrogenase [Stenotrophomonas]|jgi:dihydroorotate dehydrogenase|uniref:Dihydroorotate dehydrogenase (quinone) n=1 Tax=Stenotrophomonas acidaminiphila TaxID=128780 RepID=A0A0S1B088_9GAMM|nr:MULTISPECIES: quinone-dependent dihydroorotate dehydrogenase [Stenotrophomonas]ODU45949.1 MAG: dihydroorotate dehydrogenase (quinone) [Xanthomonadaceae bacterium SCN 69-123]OJY76739.1 MAG: dihydroorotate dehydrogenase (quinone) [Stenotrophomonas sp. 69-14]OZB51769.1 MAG: dihydroorotate dehydrogenase (quinone) [Stenotrophomonas sp. 14-69-23]ALJ28472.1 dihydroorotate dehydrogenase 2 [Stenotrophomonas acidaminiphila]MBN8803085.1 quinone-dependent dihydroorotate dehydrogenase [Stenotrophomonas 
MYPLVRPFLFAFDAERAHGLALSALELAWRTGTTPLLAARPAPMPTSVFGLDFPNPVGLAAGLDKNGEHIDALFGLGFGFVEIGTVTPRPQAGNPKPRLFRLPQHAAIINRMGFNNAGVDALVRNVERSSQRTGPLGINIGKNKDTPNEDALSDYLACLEKVYPLADYVTVNISSPNTAGLRELQEEQALRRLVGGLREAQERLASQHGRRVPMLVKVAPDLSDRDIEAAARVLSELEVDGVIATNTTIGREGVEHDRRAAESGGLSGAPLLGQSTLVLRRLRARLPERIPLIGVGGIQSGADAVAKMSAGATLVQCYSGLIFRGPALIGECVDAIRRRREAPSRGAVAPL